MSISVAVFDMRSQLAPKFLKETKMFRPLLRMDEIVKETDQDSYIRLKYCKCFYSYAMKYRHASATFVSFSLFSLQPVKQVKA